MTLKTLTETGLNQKFTRKVREESVEAIWTIEHFVYDPMDVSSKPLANIRIM